MKLVRCSSAFVVSSLVPAQECSAETKGLIDSLKVYVGTEASACPDLVFESMRYFECDGSEWKRVSNAAAQP